MAHPENFRIILFLSMLAGMFFLETFVHARAWHDARAKRLGFHALISIFNSVVTRLLFLGPFLVWLEFVHERGWGITNWVGLDGVAEILTTLIVFDCFNYWWHRCNHLVPFLWRFHRAHHLDTHVDVTTSLRFHPGELALSYGVKAVWILIWGPSALAFLIFEAAITTYAQFHHSNIDFPDQIEKILRLVHMTPRLHTSHHTVSRRTRDANYSTIFLVWDRLFATLREPDHLEMQELGLPEGRKSDLSLWAWLKSPVEVDA